MDRLKHFVACSTTEIKDRRGNESIESESKRILDKVNQRSILCLLEVGNKQLSSRKLARRVEDWQLRGIKEVSFIIGGADGVSTEIVQKADFKLSLSLLTFTHDMARVILLEQLYRSYTILKGYPYQR